MSPSSSPTNPGHATSGPYWSIDSAPPILTRPLSHWAAPLVLLIFTLLSAGMMLAINRIPVLVAMFPNHDLLFSPYAGSHAVPLRIFIMAFYIAFVAVSGAGLYGRVRFFWHLTSYFALLCAVYDGMNALAFYQTGYVYSLQVVEILSGLSGYMIFSVCLLRQGAMPKRVPVPFNPRLELASWLRLTIATVVAAAISVYVDGLNLPLLVAFRQFALLGGTGPGVFLFLPMLALLLYFSGTVQAVYRRKAPFAPPVTLIIPAHNEAHIIARTLAAIEAAALVYGSKVVVLVLDNCSTDDTALAANAAFKTLPHLEGRVIDVPRPGKSVALNAGIVAVRTEFVIRIDADTQVEPRTLIRAMRHFYRPQVGVVGGIPLAPGTGPFDRARTLEVLLKHGIYQVAYGALDAIVGVPGMFAAYRTQLVRAVGGFATGMNGEDTDMSLRIGESGARVIVDPSVFYTSEVPLSYRHLREQRMRWFRSVYHVSARNRACIDDWTPSLRGKIVLPFMLLNSARRAMTVPLAIFGAVDLLMAVEPNSILTVEAVIAVLIGAPALMGAFAALANGRPGALIGLPEYVLFRVVRAYLTLESVLSIAFDQQTLQQRLEHRKHQFRAARDAIMARRPRPAPQP